MNINTGLSMLRRNPIWDSSYCNDGVPGWYTGLSRHSQYAVLMEVQILHPNQSEKKKNLTRTQLYREWLMTGFHYYMSKSSGDGMHRTNFESETNELLKTQSAVSPFMTLCTPVLTCAHVTPLVEKEFGLLISAHFTSISVDSSWLYCKESGNQLQESWGGVLNWEVGDGMRVGASGSQQGKEQPSLAKHYKLYHCSPSVRKIYSIPSALGITRDQVK